MKATLRKKALLGLGAASAFALFAFFAGCATHEDPSTEPKIPSEPNPIAEAGTDAKGVTDAGEDASKPRCSEDGFCYVSVPSPKPLRAVSASSVDDAWMLSQDSGEILRWDGTALKEVYRYSGTSPSSVTFMAIWAQKKDDIWAVAKDADDNLFFVRYASPPGGGAPTFRELKSDASAKNQAAFGWPPSVWGSPSGETLWLTLSNTLLRVREDAGRAVVERINPAADEDGGGDYWWFGVWGFGDDDVYAGGGESLSHDNSRAAIAHFDGNRWANTLLDSRELVLSLRGTPPGTKRELWSYVSEPLSYSSAVRTELIPIVDGALGVPVVSRAPGIAPVCGSRLGQATAPGLGWFSEGVLVCRWSPTRVEALTAAPGAPVVDSIQDVWAGGEDDVWIVGTALARPGIPQGPFAARRTAATAKGSR